MKTLFLTIIFSVLVHASTSYYYDNGVKIDVTKLETSSQTDYYMNSKNQTMGVNNTFIVKFSSTVNIQDVQTKYDIILNKDLGNNSYVFETNENVFVTSSQIFENENVEYSQPNFIKQRRRR